MTAHDLVRELPDIPELQDRCRALAMLEAIVGYGSAYPTYVYDAAWAPGVELASMRNGGGDEWDIAFTADGAWIRGFDHESPMSPYGNEDLALWPGLVESVPGVFAALVAEPAFQAEDCLAATLCVWRRIGDDGWRTGDVSYPEHHAGDPDGAGWMFQTLLRPSGYREWAEDMWEVTLDGDAVDAVLALRPLTPELLRGLHPEATVGGLVTVAGHIGYPISANRDAV
ncbi:hypothetical protein ACIA8K_17465 [Catenuloplanes sp. NPDC051500]|uniref:hypothetical protein n=1 Tax=Catenuloplanes sp. NPDC051500 TaxID=3363959 RepID=UPI00379D8BA1